MMTAAQTQELTYPRFIPNALEGSRWTIVVADTPECRELVKLIRTHLKPALRTKSPEESGYQRNHVSTRIDYREETIKGTNYILIDPLCYQAFWHHKALNKRPETIYFARTLTEDCPVPVSWEDIHQIIEERSYRSPNPATINQLWISAAEKHLADPELAGNHSFATFNLC